jgi:CRP-like cAMP-binding protein
LEISPLFFLGSTLIFIGYDLMYEWLWEVRHQVFLSEYGIVWFTFASIHVVGIDFGIIIGVLIAIIEQIVTTAQSSSISRVEKRSRAVWTPSDAKILHDHAYSSFSPKIVTLEVIGTVFFGSALSLLNRIAEETGLDIDEIVDNVLASPPGTPHTSSSILTLDRRPSFAMKKKTNIHRRPPKYLVLDLMRVSNLDASASKGCFLQLVKMCAKRDIIVCASGVTPRIEWMFRSHAVSISDQHEEESAKAQMLSREYNKTESEPFEKILLFATLQEALEFSETSLIQSFHIPNRASQSLSQIAGPEEQSLASVLAYILGASEDEKQIFERLENQRYHDEVKLKSGGTVFHKNTHSDSFSVVLRGCVANSSASARQKLPVVSGAGFVRTGSVGNLSNLCDTDFRQQQNDSLDKTVSTLWQMGGIFGYNDYLLERPRSFQALATQDGTKVARFTHSHMNLLQTEDSPLYGLMQKVLLHACTLDLANCTCHDV